MMNRKMKTKVTWSIVAVMIVAAIGGYAWYYSQPGPYDAFAQCIRDSGTTFYGAFWCPHCQEQKKMFDRSERLLPYVECSTPNGNGTTLVCQQKNITQYPTWEFANGERQVGTMTLEALAQKTNCSLK